MTETKSALVLEGGGTRGVFTSGVLDCLMKHGVEFPYVVGVSAGACNAVDYVSRQPLRTKECMILDKKEENYISFKQAVRNKSLFDMDLIFDRFPNDLHPFDYETYFQSETECELVVTDCATGRAAYLKEQNDRKRLMDICRASSSIPALCPMVEVDGKEYLDGGIADSIPLLHAMKKGYRKNVVVLTRNFGYRKQKPGKSRALYLAAFRDYPELLNTVMNRYRNYNRTLELIEKWEREGHIYVIRPQIKPVSRTEKNKKALDEFYFHGYDLMESRLADLEKYMKE